MKDDSDPLRSWRIDEIIQHSSFAKKDMYGSLFFYLRKLLLQFCHQFRNSNVDLQLFQVDALELPSLLKRGGQANYSFDRIEVSNITDRGYLGLELTLSIFGPLLKPRSQNPKATLLALFLNAIHEESYGASVIASLESDKDRICRYLPLTREVLANARPSSADFIRFIEASAMFRDFDKPFRRFMEQCRFSEISAVNGLRMKEKNSIVKSWPLRLGERATANEFDILHASGHHGSERYVEWERAI